MSDRAHLWKLVALSCWLVGACAEPNPPKPDPVTSEPAVSAVELEKTRELLRAYRTESLSSGFGRDPSVLVQFESKRPVAALLELFEQRDSTVDDLEGTSWAIVCETVGPEPFVDPLVERLGDKDPSSRVFACEALETIDVNGEKVADAAVPALVAMLADDEVVPGYAGSPTVASFAASALASMNRSDGIDVLLKTAETASDWHLSYGRHFRALSGQDFGEDLDAYKAWFAENGRGR